MPESYYKEVKSTIKYGRDNLDMDIVLNALRSKEFEMKLEKDSEALIARGRPKKKSQNKHRGK